jgi:REP element-mobilizing transposase RayT
MGVEEFYQRHLPHYQPFDADFHVVFRLSGSLPVAATQQLRAERDLEKKRLAGGKKSKAALQQARQAYFEKFGVLLDSSAAGPRWLEDDRIASIVAEAIHHRDGRFYDLHTFTIMPNHVHMVLHVSRRDSSTYGLTDILENLKWYTALKANGVLGRRGAFWQHESYDHVIRDGEELERTIWYVLQNPVKAGLVEAWDRWPWSFCKSEFLS